MLASDEIHNDIDQDQKIDFCTLGMFIIDEIHYLPPKPSVYDALGGGGTYAAIGARLFSPAPISKRIGWIVDRGSDFPPTLTENIRSLKTSCYLRVDESRLTTRGWNGYDESDVRGFKYTTTKLRLDADSLVECPALLKSSSFHMICSPLRCIELVKNIKKHRKEIAKIKEKPLFIWEPVPDLCVPGELLNLTRALSYVDICSPNTVELGNLLGYSADEVESPNGDVNPDFVEKATEQLLESMALSSFAIVVRTGKSGCFIGQNGGGKESKLAVRSNTKNEAAAQSYKASERQQERLAKKKEKERLDAKGRFNRKRKTHLTRAGNTYASPTPRVPKTTPHSGLTADTDMLALLSHLSTRDETSTEEEEEETETETEDEPQPAKLPNSPPESSSDGETDFGTSLWLPAYHQTSEKVIDPTGGGNAFLGGLATALARGKGLEAAARWGTIAASFTIEQVGMPVLTSTAEGEELWNGESVAGRLRTFEHRLGLSRDKMTGSLLR